MFIATMITLGLFTFTCANPERSDEAMIVRIIALWMFIGKIHSITADNSKEFAVNETVSSILGAPIFFAHPYSSWEHGSSFGMFRHWPRPNANRAVL
jgi:IS30 family transposase